MERAPQEAPAQAGFVAINAIRCSSAYAHRFEELFQTRARAIDAMEGFLGMRVLKPTRDGDPYLVVSFWRDASCFQGWLGSEAFRQGHERAFRDMEEAKTRGEEPPMHSTFSTYTVLAH